MDGFADIPFFIGLCSASLFTRKADRSLRSGNSPRRWGLSEGFENADNTVKIVVFAALR